jgi:uncharacterized protein DUF1308
LSFSHAVWAYAKHCHSITRLTQHTSPTHIIADGGLLWIKLSTLTEKRLLTEMAAKGWWSTSQSDSENDDGNDGDIEMRSPKSDDDDDLNLIKAAKELLARAKESRPIRYRSPRITFVLTRIQPGSCAEIDQLLCTIRDMGITVQTAADIPRSSPPLTPELLKQMAFDESTLVTPTLNLDCTILLALASDMSHAREIDPAWEPRLPAKQVRSEREEVLVTSVLWPVMRGRELVCTREAARRMREITEEIGMVGEKARMEILLGDGPNLAVQGEDEGVKRREAFQKWTEYEVPGDWRLPVRICESVGADDGRLPHIARKVAVDMSELNRSVCLFGWAEGFTTITGNRMVVRTIEKIVVKERESEEVMGPDLFVSWNSRSLVAKEKERRDVK